MNAKKKIMVVDDDPDILEQLSIILQSGGYETRSIASQREAEEALLLEKPDLAIVDLMMEDSDSGFIVCHHLKRLYPETPVILLTAVRSAAGLSLEVSDAKVQQWVKAERILDKPVRPEQLLAEIRRLLHEPEMSNADGH